MSNITISLTDQEIEYLSEMLFQEAKSESVFCVLDSETFDLLLGLLEKIAPGHTAFKALRKSRAEYLVEIESGTMRVETMDGAPGEHVRLAFEPENLILLPDEKSN